VAYAVLPARDQGRFLSLLDEGALDEVIAKALRRSWARRVLVTSDQADRAGMWHDLRPQGLVPAERDLAGLLTRAGRGGSGHRDDAKQRADESSPSTPGGGPRLPLRLVAVLVAGALVLGAGLATAVAMTRAPAETTPPPVVAASTSEAAPAPGTSSGTSSGTSPTSEPSPTAPATSAAPPPSPAPTKAVGGSLLDELVRDDGRTLAVEVPLVNGRHQDRALSRGPPCASRGFRLAAGHTTRSPAPWATATGPPPGPQSTEG